MWHNVAFHLGLHCLPKYRFRGLVECIFYVEHQLRPLEDKQPEYITSRRIANDYVKFKRVFHFGVLKCLMASVCYVSSITFY